MANTGVIFGGDIMLYRNTGTDVAPIWTPFAHATSHSYSGSTNMRESSDKDDGGQTTVKPGRHAPSTISISGLKSYDGDDFFALEQARLDREKLQIKYSGRPTGDENAIDTVEDTGDKYMEAYGYVSECGSEDPHDGDATYSATITLSTQPEIKSVA